MSLIITLVMLFLLNASAFGQESATITGPIQVWNGGKYLGYANGTLYLPPSDIGLLEHGTGGQMVPGQTYALRLTNSSYTLPPKPPAMPTSPPSYVTDTPTLVFSDQFNQGNTQLASELSEWGPITGSVKWQTAGKADGSKWSLSGFQTAVNGSTSYVGAGNYYDASSGWLNLNDKCWIQDAANWQWKGGMNNWYTPALCSAAYYNGLGGNYGNVSGAEWKAPFYFEAAVWLPQLQPWDAHWASGLWPSISFYTDPTSTAAPIELDLFEVYSVNYALPHCAWHVYGNSPSSGGSNFSNTQFPDLSLGWHTWGLWVDTNTITWYLDGTAIFSAPNPNTGNVPMYVVIAAAMGGSGWQGGETSITMCPSSVYTMQIGSVAVFGQ